MEPSLATGELDLHLCGRAYQLSFVACDKAPRWRCRAGEGQGEGASQEWSGYLPVVSTALHIEALVASLDDADAGMEAAMRPELYAQRIWAACDPDTPAPRDPETQSLSLAPLLWWTAQAPPRSAEGLWQLGRHEVALAPWSFRARAKARRACMRAEGGLDLARFMAAELAGCLQSGGTWLETSVDAASLPCQLLKGVERCLDSLSPEAPGELPEPGYARRLFALSESLGMTPLALEAMPAPQLDRLLALAEAAGLGDPGQAPVLADSHVAAGASVNPQTALEADPSSTVFYFE